jgi:nucleoside-diphosphate-sugar epimerase
LKTVVLTGADGYVGRPVLAGLQAAGYDVHAISRTPGKSAKAVTWHTADLFDPVATDAILEKIGGSHLVHLAWITEPGAYWQSPDNDRWREASVALLQQFIRYGGQRAVLAGTCAEYDWRHGHCDEDSTPLRPQSPYTRGKLEFRDAAYALSEKSGLEMAWARIFFSFGPNEHPKRLVPAVIRALLVGERAECSDGEQLRDFMYVEDLAAAFVAVLDSNFCGDINIASGNAMPIRRLVTRIAEKLHAVDRVDFGARPRQSGEPDSITADVSRLTEQVGYSSHTTIESAIDESIAWWRQQLAQ